MSVKTIIQEAINKSPVSLKEALEEELRTRVALALEAKMKDDEEDEDEDEDDDSDEDEDEKCESVEQMDEISNKTLDSYLHRSTTRLPKDGDNSIGSLKSKSRAHKTLGDEEEADRLMKKAKTREKYFGKALARREVQAGELKKDGSIHRNGNVYQLDKKAPLMKDLKKVPSPYFKESFDLSDYTVEELEDFMMSKEFGQIDELDRKTLASYVKKASADAAMKSGKAEYEAGRAHDATYGGESPDHGVASRWRARSDKSSKTASNRLKGISRATDRLAK